MSTFFVNTCLPIFLYEDNRQISDSWHCVLETRSSFKQEINPFWKYVVSYKEFPFNIMQWRLIFLGCMAAPLCVLSHDLLMGQMHCKHGPPASVHKTVPDLCDQTAADLLIQIRRYDGLPGSLLQKRRWTTDLSKLRLQNFT